MQNDILEKLKIKNQPKVEKVMEYNIPRSEEDVKINTTIIDKTKEQDIDVMRFADILNKKKRVKKRQINFSDVNIDEPRGVEETKGDNEEQDEDAIQDDEVGQRTVVIKPTKIKKLSRKIILNTKPREKKDTDTDDKSVVKRNIPSPIGVIQTGPLSSIQIKDEKIENRIPKKEKPIQIKASSYYLNNRQIFINYITGIFNKYKQEINQNKATASCDRDENADFKLMSHQKIVRDYISTFTPYRGLLLYHGLGSGKT